MDPWPHQIAGVEAVLASSSRRICLTSPTGGGKTWIMSELIRCWSLEGLKVALYTNRKALLEQTHEELKRFGIAHGVRASGWYEEPEQSVQLCSIQTEATRARKATEHGTTYCYFPADRILIDEAHLNKEESARELIEHGLHRGAVVVGLTATPIALGGIYDQLIVAGRNSELRDCGALVPAYHYGPDEPDLRILKRPPALGDDFSATQQRKLMNPARIVGRVLDWFRKLNPARRPTILFAPGVPESLWFAQQFAAAGISAAHIDGDDCWINGRLVEASPDARKEILDGSRDGRICVICNRYVCREGINAPWLGHCILATLYGSLGSYMQSGGRVLRAYPGLSSVTIQDHGGNWWRHGSLNADRTWNLSWSSARYSGQREDRLREKQEVEPCRCPLCGLIINRPECVCGWVRTGKRTRPVIQESGAVIELAGDIFKPRRTYQRPDGPGRWKAMYHRSRTAKGDRTFRAAAALFAQENFWQYPDKNWPLMPIDAEDWWRKVQEVPREVLR